MFHENSQTDAALFRRLCQRDSKVCCCCCMVPGACLLGVAPSCCGVPPVAARRTGKLHDSPWLAAASTTYRETQGFCGVAVAPGLHPRLRGRVGASGLTIVAIAGEPKVCPNHAQALESVRNREGGSRSAHRRGDSQVCEARHRSRVHHMEARAGHQRPVPPQHHCWPGA